MKKLILFCAPLFAAADPGLLQRIADQKLSPPQRAAACFALRGQRDPETIQALSRALEDKDLLSCAAENLRIAGAIEPLNEALTGSANPMVRAAAARQIGSFHRADLLEALSVAARDENLLVATNALAGLSQYTEPSVVPFLADLARHGGMTGDMALERLAQLDEEAALSVSRTLLASAQVADKLYAMKTIGALGGPSDVPELRKIAAENPDSLGQRDRGFGFMPAINLARAAQAAIAAIESRRP